MPYKPLKHIVRPNGVKLHLNSRILAVQAQPAPPAASASAFRIVAGLDKRSGTALDQAELSRCKPVQANDADDAILQFEELGFTDVRVMPDTGAACAPASGYTVLWELADVRAIDAGASRTCKVVLAKTGEAVGDDVVGMTYAGTVQHIGSTTVVHVFIDTSETGSIMANSAVDDLRGILDQAKDGVRSLADRIGAAVQAAGDRMRKT